MDDCGSRYNNNIVVVIILDAANTQQYKISDIMPISDLNWYRLIFKAEISELHQKGKCSIKTALTYIITNL